MKAAVYDPYLDTLGGGERYCLTVAEILIKNGYQVDIFWSGDPKVIDIAQKRFSLDISKIRVVPDIFNYSPSQLEYCPDCQSISTIARRCPPPPLSKIKNLFHRLKILSSYSLIFYLGDGSLPFLFGKKNLLHIQVPFNRQPSFKNKILNRLKIKFVKKVICNSIFTQKYAQKYYHHSGLVLYPPVDIAKLENGTKKENIIISVGRFDNILNSKKQDILIDIFSQFYNSIPGWRLILAGGSLENPSQNKFLLHLQNLAKNLPVEFLVNPSFTDLKNLFSRSKIYWHAAGFGVNQELHPENTEHFGITLVEAMASGAVPLAIARGGLPEIINSKIDGYLWSTSEELISQTKNLIDSPAILQKMSQAAVQKSKIYSKENFETEFLKIIND